MLAMHAALASDAALWREPAPGAALYCPEGPHGPALPQAEQVQGKELSYNNYNDADAALELAANSRASARPW
jgi:phosphoribosylaminoimidazolecarboxamide formyltransferase/IMP cyclohydrolase